MEKFKIGDRVTRSKKHPHYKNFIGLIGTVAEVLSSDRYKVKWDKKSGKWIPNLRFGKFIADSGQQHSTLQAKFLTKV